MEEAQTKTQSPWHMIRRLIPDLGVHKSWLGLVWFTALIAGIMEFINPYLLKNLTDTAIAQQTDAFWRLVLWALAAMLVDVALKYFTRVIAIRYEIYTIRDLRDRVTAHIQRLPISYTDTFHSGDLVSRLNNDIDKIAMLPKRVHELVQQPVVFILGFSYMLILSWKLLLATCILIPASAVLYNIVVKPMQAHSQKEMEHLARANAVTQDAIRGILIIKAFNLERILTVKYRLIAEDVRKEGLEIDKRRAVEFAVFLMLRYIPQLVAPLYGGFLAFQGEITVGALIACNYLIWMIFRPVETMLGWMSNLREVAPAVERIYEILDQPVEDSKSYQFQALEGTKALSFRSVDFQYSEDIPILDQFSLDVEKGQIVALVGSSGCGKSTVLKLLCGFYRPHSGQILIEGRDILQSGIRAARSQVSLVSQETYLFPTTIAENIAYGRHGATQHEIREAARAANAHDFITNLPGGYDTQVGEWGSKLSGGEKQRIALARAILKNAPILLLDEPTSALDAQSEAVVQEALERFMRGRTVLVIAHRLSTIKNVDAIVVLDQGRLVEQGTHQELMRSETHYKRLYLKQTDLEELHA
jgi:subfamily B ATP-binding cassette protein MsbA/ATP-binding cassette subfamily B protein AbcA/BmrA